MTRKEQINLNRHKVKQLREAKRAQHILRAESKDAVRTLKEQVEQLSVKSAGTTKQIKELYSDRKKTNNELKELRSEVKKHRRTSKSAWSAIRSINLRIRQLIDENRRLRGKK